MTTRRPGPEDGGTAGQRDGQGVGASEAPTTRAGRIRSPVPPGREAAQAANPSARAATTGAAYTSGNGMCE